VSQAIALLERCATPAGFLAALEPRSNYRRVWARDGSICSLAALEAGHAPLVEAARATLETLADHRGPSGQLPSNVTTDGTQVSYGGNAGRVDATLWWLVAAAQLARRTEHDEWLDARWPVVVDALRLLRAWELNDGGLIYVPATGDWADEYLLSGYLLYDQVLRLWALRELEAAADRLGRPLDHERGHLAELLATRFGPDDSRDFFLAGHNPCERFACFDAFGNALCCLLEVGSGEARRRTFDHALALTRHDLVPAFDPPVEPHHPDYRRLEHAASGPLRNRPGRYHNGGLWPLNAGFWALAARKLGANAAAERWRAGIASANRLGSGFPEYLDANDGSPGGTQGQAWSAAAEILAAADPGGLLPPAA
jgi:GH15 family glucan-1,4-alpha-glucosidase